MASTIPQYNVKLDTLNVESDASLIQKGKYAKPSFYSDVSTSSLYSTFVSGINTALSYAGNANIAPGDIVTERTTVTGYKLTYDEYALVQKRALSISAFSKVPYDVVVDFLIILCFVDNLSDTVSYTHLTLPTTSRV